MQTVEENKINYIVFPYTDWSWENEPVGNKSYYLYAYQTMANDTGSFSYMSSSVQERDERWRVATSNIITEGTPALTELRLNAGTTYELQLWYALQPQITWKETTTEWINTPRRWGDDPFIGTPHIVLNSDRIFVSGSVSPVQKQYISPDEQIIIASGSTDMNETIYISSNEDAVLKIYQG